MVNVTRNANGISLNAGHRQYLCNDNNVPIKFKSKETAIKYLKQKGVVDLDGIKFPTVTKKGVQ